MTSASFWRRTGIYTVMGGNRVDIEKDALLLMIKQGGARLFEIGD